MPQREPTNAVLLKEIKDIKDMQVNQGKDVAELMAWKTSENAYRAALAQVRKEDENSKYQTLRDGELQKRTEVLKQIGIITGIIIAILYAYAATHGIKTT